MVPGIREAPDQAREREDRGEGVGLRGGYENFSILDVLRLLSLPIQSVYPVSVPSFVIPQMLRQSQPTDIEARSSTAREFGGSILYDYAGRYIRLSRRLCISWNKVHRNKIYLTR